MKTKVAHYPNSLLLLIAVTFLLIQSSQAQIQITNLDGGAVTTSLGLGGKVNAKSSLRRSWIVINDPSCPIQIAGNGIQTRYEGSDYSFRAVGSFVPNADTSAFEIRYVLFDLFGNHIATIADTEVADWKSGKQIALNGAWTASHDDAMELLTVVTFISQARTPDGKVWRYDPVATSQHLASLNLKNDGVLNPAPPAKK